MKKKIKVLLLILFVVQFGRAQSGGFKIFLESGVFSGQNTFSKFRLDDPKVFFQMHFSPGLTLGTRNFFLGAGVGFEKYFDHYSIPVYGLVRVALSKSGFQFNSVRESGNKRQVTPYMEFSMGQSYFTRDSLSANDFKIENSIYLNSGLGLIVSGFESVGIVMNLNYRFQQYILEDDQGILTAGQFDGISAKLGVMISF